MTHQINLQNVSTCAEIPKRQQIRKWINAALVHSDTLNAAAEITVRIVDKAESAELNERYRKKTGPTNVLSFSYIKPSLQAQRRVRRSSKSEGGSNDKTVGDLVICAPLLIEEALAQSKTVESHWAHLVIHGTLHLLGYDHQNDEEAVVMETKEIAIMKQLGYLNPYLLV